MLDPARDLRDALESMGAGRKIQVSGLKVVPELCWLLRECLIYEELVVGAVLDLAEDRWKSCLEFSSLPKQMMDPQSLHGLALVEVLGQSEYKSGSVAQEYCCSRQNSGSRSIAWLSHDQHEELLVDLAALVLFSDQHPAVKQVLLYPWLVRFCPVGVKGSP